MANSVQKTMQVLRALSDHRGKAVTLAQLSRQTAINKSTLSHIIKVLCADGYVSRISHSEGYTVGPELYFLTRYGRFGEELSSSCHSLLTLLNRKTGGTAIFAVINQGKKYIIDYVEGYISYSDSGATILSDDLYRTVTGKLLLSSLPTYKAIDIFRKNGAPDKEDWEGVSTEKDYLNELERLRGLSVFVTEEKTVTPSLISFATLIYRNKKCVAALGLVQKKEDCNYDESVSLIKKCKKEAERRLSFK